MATIFGIIGLIVLMTIPFWARPVTDFLKKHAYGDRENGDGR
jgi:hypothetical protein